MLAQIIECYAFEAGDYCTEVARNTYRAFAPIGILAWIQDAVRFSEKPTIEASDKNEPSLDISNDFASINERLIFIAKSQKALHETLKKVLQKLNQEPEEKSET